MPQFDILIAALLRNAPLLLVVLPLVGAFLVLVTLALGSEAARRTAQANAFVTACLATLLVVPFTRSGSAEATGEIVTTRAWEWTTFTRRVIVPGGTPEEPKVVEVRSGPPVRIVFGIDGLNVWFAVLATLVAFPVLQVAPTGPRDGPFYVLLLLHQACLLGAFLAMDVLLFCFLSELAVVLAFPMIGLWGGYDRRTAAGRWLAFQGVAGTLVLAGAMLLLVVWRAALANGDGVFTGHFDVASLVGPSASLREKLAAHPSWFNLAPWAFLTLLTGFVLRSACFPLHTWFVPVSLEAPRAYGLLLAAVGTKLGLYGLMRFVVPIFPEACANVAPLLRGIGVFGLFFAALLTLAQGNLLKFATCATLASLAMALAGVFTRSSVGLSGAVLVLLHHGCAGGLLLYAVVLLGERYETYDVEAYGGLSQRFPRLAVLFGISMAGLAGLPGGSGFVAWFLVAGGLFPISGRLVLGLVLGTLVLVWALLWTWGRLFTGRFREPVLGDPGSGRWSLEGADQVRDANWAECLAALPLVVGVLTIGLWPRAVLDSVGRSAEVAVAFHDEVAEPAPAEPPADESEGD